jgi:hypothetical protein
MKAIQIEEFGNPAAAATQQMVITHTIKPLFLISRRLS